MSSSWGRPRIAGTYRFGALPDDALELNEGPHLMQALVQMIYVKLQLPCSLRSKTKAARAFSTVCPPKPEPDERGGEGGSIDHASFDLLLFRSQLSDGSACLPQLAFAKLF